MGHDLHFIQRLDRLDDRLVDFALSLYRNPALVQAIVEEAAPKDAPRVAIALADTPLPPHLLVDRDGRFVTCLAAGMRHDLPVISRAALDLAAGRKERLRRALEVARGLRSDRSFADRTMRVYEGPRLSREEMHDLMAWAPALESRYLHMFFESLKGHDAARMPVRAALRLKRRHTDNVQQCWEGAWAMGHLDLGSRGALEGIYSVPADDEPEAYRVSNVAACIHPFLSATALRGVWVAGAIGEVIVDDAETRYRRSTDVFLGFAAALALLAIGLRWPKLHGRVAGILSAMPGFASVPSDSDRAAHARWNDVLKHPARAVGRHHDDAVSRLTSLGWDLAKLDVSTVLAASLCEGRVLGRAEDHHALIDAVPFAAASEAEELYLPAAVLARQPPEDPAASAAAYAEFLRASLRDATPAPAPPPTAGRNEPCPCGSAKKFKKCCGA